MLSAATRSAYQTLLDAHALAGPDECAAIIYVATDEEPIFVSRGLFRNRVQAYAAALRRLDIRPRDLVVIAHTQNLESIYAFWGALLAGAVPSMFPTLTEKLDPAIYMGSMAELARLSQVRAVLTTDDFAGELRARVGCAVYGSGELAAAAEGDPLEPVAPRPADVAFLQHSSGTTGLQKGVALAHDAVLNQVAHYSDALQLNEADVIASWLPLYHDMGLIAGFILPLLQGIPLVLMSPFDWVRHPALLLRAIHDFGATLCWLPNFAYNHMARRVRQRDSEGLSLRSMRLFVNCSEPVRHSSHQQFLQRFAANGVEPAMLGVSYAMAENTFAVTQTPPGAPARLDTVNSAALQTSRLAAPAAAADPAADIRVSCGPPIPGTAVRVLDAQGQPLDDRRVGEIAIRSDCMLSGYYRRPDLQPFRDGWYLTGDMGYLAEGELYVIGRSKDLIISAGKNIYPQDIEDIVNDVPGVKAGRAVAFGVPDEREGTELLAVVAETTTDEPDELQAVNRAIRLEVSRRSMVTVNYVTLVGPMWLIKTSSGKIARAANRDKWLAERRDLPGF